MKIIGIVGKPGSGKSTFTDMLGERKNVGVIHVDNLLGEKKKKYMRVFLQGKSKNTTESNKQNPKVKIGVKKLFYSNKYTFLLLMKIRTMLVQKEIESKLRAFKQEGKGVAVIDDWMIATNRKTCEQLNEVYLIERDFIDRRKGLRQRDAASIEEARIADIPYARKYVSMDHLGAKTIQNNGSKEDLRKAASAVYAEIGELTFDEKYRVDNTKEIATALEYYKKISKQQSKNGQRKEYNE